MINMLLIITTDMYNSVQYVRFSSKQYIYQVSLWNNICNCIGLPAPLVLWSQGARVSRNTQCVQAGPWVNRWLLMTREASVVLSWVIQTYSKHWLHNSGLLYLMLGDRPLQNPVRPALSYAGWPSLTEPGAACFILCWVTVPYRTHC